MSFLPSISSSRSHKTCSHDPVGVGDIRPLFRQWIDTMAAADNRLYYRDQTPEALQWLAETVHRVAPTRIVELGTLAGLSLRTFIEATQGSGAGITAVDLSFNTLRESAKRVPLDLSRVQLLERNILELDFSDLWTAKDTVLLFIDAHDQPKAPIMAYLLEHALPCLPPGSVVVVDDLWHSPRPLSQDTADDFLRERVLHEIDVLQCFTGYFAPYRSEGSFMGFAEVVPLMRFVNAQGIDLCFDPAVKSVSFAWPRDRSAEQPPLAPLADPLLEGHISHNPLKPNPAETSREIDVQAAGQYRLCRFQETETLLHQALGQGASTGLGYFGLAVCRARQGDLRQTLGYLDEELATAAPHPAAMALRQDIVSFLDRKHARAHGTASGVTLFAMPKAFSGHIGIIQRNAITSWTRMTPKPRIILFGDDPGTKEMADELDLIHEPNVPRNEHGTPLVDGLFNAAARLAGQDVLAYVNADIILMDDFMYGVAAARRRFETFLMLGRRYDLLLDQAIDFSDPDWSGSLRAELDAKGILHAECGLDYFVHTPGFWGEIPPFALGRTAWDNWLISAPLHHAKTVLDASPCVTAIHQHHDYGHLKDGLRAAYFGEEAIRNRALAEATPKVGTGSSCDAPYELRADGLILKRGSVPPQFETEQFKAQRREWLDVAVTRHLQAGKPELALVHLEELAIRFPGDQVIATQLDSLRSSLSPPENR